MAGLNHDRMTGVILAAILLLLLLISWSGESAAQEDRGLRRFPLQAGFRKAEFTYSAGGAPKTCAFRIWYPSAGAARSITYAGGQAGHAAENAPVAAGAHPVILFSHGLWSNPEFTAFLTEELARAGYVVAGVLHGDATTAEKGGWEKMSSPKFDKPGEWDETSYVDRRNDLTALLDHLLQLDQQEGSFLQGRINREAIGAMGHSLGGHTVLGAVGGWTSWRDKRIRAALLLSPYILPYLDHGDLASVDVPVMMQGATFDLGITPSLPALHQKLSSPKYLLVLKDQTHLAWLNHICRGRNTVDAVKEELNARLITDYSVAFFDHHLTGAARKSGLLTQANPALASYEFPGRKK
jgi:predicted dienelactone hydrolase